MLKQYFEGGGKEKGRQGFDCIIIDEATQAIELDTLIPLQYGTTKLILVGDPEQLPPTVVSQVGYLNQYKPSVPFLGHRQTVQTQIRHRRMWRLIRVFTVY